MKSREWILHHGRQLGTVAVLAVLGVTFAVRSEYFLTISNLTNVAEQVVINAIIAVGLTYVIIMAGIDLSVGSILAAAGVVMGMALKADWPIPAAIGLSILIGAGCGAVNGLFVTYGKLPPFIATLGMMSIARGAALVIAGGKPVSGFSEGFRAIANGNLAEIPVPVIIMCVVYAGGHWGLTRTTIGRYIYAIGGNEQAARFSGINITRVKITVYALCGALAAGAGVILTSRLNSAQPTAGMMYELDAIAAAVIGGTSLMGGQGNVFGTLVGALIMGVLRNGLNLLDVSSYMQQSVIGGAIIAAVLVDMALKRKRN
ncbi:ABC transporter permease [Candidatus Sumerlaeota bacterium]|nr:ABC transporter permease [Candidatus Sumerlaeota bacterium]MBI3736391.1 ABC transporter permease [Candidatus Sumerlaeota bacterium]